MPRRLSVPVAVAVTVAVATAVVLAYVGLRNFLWQPDEALFVQLGRYVGEHFPSSVFEYGVYERGPQRLTVFMLTVLQWLFDAPTALQVGHVLQAALYVTVAMPAYLLARAVRLAPLEAAIAAILAIIVPWAVVGTTFLTEAIAYPLSAFVLLAAWRTTTQPSRRRDALAILAVLLAVLAKTSLVALAPVLAIAPLVQSIRYPRDGPQKRWRALPSQLWAEHSVLVAATAAAVAAAVVWLVAHRSTGLSSSLFGVYGTPTGIDARTLLHQSQILAARLVLGTGFIPVCLALPWLVRQLVAPSDSRDHALALVAVTSAVVLILATALSWGDDRPGVDERYVMYLAVPVFIVAPRAVVTWSVGVVGVAAAAIAVVVLVARTSWHVDLGSGVRALAYPAETFFGNAVGGRLAVYEPQGLVGHEPLVAGLVGGIAAVALTIAGRWGVRHGHASLVAGLTAATVVVAQVTQTAYTLTQWNSAQGDSPVGWAQRAWIDEARGVRKPVAILALGFANSESYTSIWDEVRFFNTSVGPVVKVRGGLAPEPPTAAKIFLEIRADDGSVVSSAPLPQFAVSGGDLRTLGLRLQQVREAPYLGVRLVRVPRKLQIDWELIDGVYPDGFMEPRGRARLRVFSAGADRDRTCARITLTGPPAYEGAWRFRITGGERPATGTVRALGERDIEVRLVKGPSHGHFRDLRIDAPHSVAYPGGRNVGLLLSRISRRSC